MSGRSESGVRHQGLRGTLTVVRSEGALEDGLGTVGTADDVLAVRDLERGRAEHGHVVRVEQR